MRPFALLFVQAVSVALAILLLSVLFGCTHYEETRVATGCEVVPTLGVTYDWETLAWSAMPQVWC